MPSELTGKTDSIHGYNPVFQYTDADEPGQFNCFKIENNKPGNFKNNLVDGSYSPSDEFPNRVFDHQGHIIPQNMLRNILEPIAKAVCGEIDKSGKTFNLENVMALTASSKYKSFHFSSLNKYIKDVLIKQGKAKESVFVTDADSLEDKIGGYFSVVIWNPLNISRAPSDDARKIVKTNDPGKYDKYPGEEIDQQMIKYLLKNLQHPGVNLQAGMETALDEMKDYRDGDTAKLTKYIAACNDGLRQLTTANGYYKALWQQNKVNFKAIQPED